MLLSSQMARYRWTDSDHAELLRLIASRGYKPGPVAKALRIDYSTLYRWQRRQTGPATTLAADSVMARIRDLLRDGPVVPKKRSLTP
jgi:hypothetical protein